MIVYIFAPLFIGWSKLVALLINQSINITRRFEHKPVIWFCRNLELFWLSMHTEEVNGKWLISKFINKKHCWIFVIDHV